MERVLTIDPGISYAWAFSIDRKLITYGKVDTSPDLSLPERLHEINFTLTQILFEHQPNLALLENLNTAFDRKVGGRTVNRKSLQIYSAAWSMLNSTISTWGIVTLYIPVGPRKCPKKLAQKIACQITGKSRIDHNCAECIVWATSYNLNHLKYYNQQFARRSL